MKNLKKNYGITLIALVITIIVLLILAGVTIATLSGDNGILQNAGKAKKETQNAQLNEETILNSYEYYMSQYANGGYIESKGVNAPVLGENMELVKYDQENGQWVAGVDYDYILEDGTDDNNKSKWANARVTIDGIDSYFVWIPRFAYKITYDADRTSGTIDVKFLIGTTDNYYDENGIIKNAKRAETEQEDTTQDYYVHPAFTNNLNLGGWNSELTGIWIGKYETSLVDTENNNGIENIITDNAETGNILLSNVENRAIAVKDGMSSWRYCTIGNMYTNAKEYAQNLNSHMLKNSEWGAVVYLTYSQYGRNKHKLGLNDNNNYITADGNIEINKNQSSTGNVYGIYDLFGGTSEYVAAYYDKNTSEIFKNSAGDLISTNGKNTQFVTLYTGIEVNSNYKIGDATYETNNWNGDYGAFINLNMPCFNRGGAYNSMNNEGIFLYSCNDGSSNFVNVGMRIGLVI